LAARVKDALEHLYDLSYLETHPLAAEGRDEAGSSPEIAGQRLRRELLAAIESLSPGPGISFRAPQARAYNLLIVHYVEGSTVQEAAHKLGISRRQAHRDLKEAIGQVAAMWAVRRATASGPAPDVSQLSSLEAEVTRLESRPRPTDLRALLAQTQETVGRLAAQRGIALSISASSERVLLSTDAVVAEQVLVSVLSRAIGQAYPGAMELDLRAGDEQVTLTVRYYEDPAAPSETPLDLVVTRLIDRLGWTAQHTASPDGPSAIVLSMPRKGPSILVIDDNEGLVTLVQRYLTDHAYRVVPARNGQDGLRLAHDLLPDAIVLDVMMPEMPGWEVLQRLRNHPKTAHIPVIICSVFNNPELAFSLGASLFLPKPIGREDVLSALHSLGVD